MKENNEQVKVAPADIPLVAKSIAKGFRENGWTTAGTESSESSRTMGFLNGEKKYLAAITLSHDGRNVSCSYNVEKVDEVVSNDEDVEEENGGLVVGGLAALAAGAIVFPITTLAGGIGLLTAALFSSSTEDEITADAIKIIREKLTEIESRIESKRKLAPQSHYDLFISYRKDGGQDFARSLYDYYKNKGKSVFFYQAAQAKLTGYINAVTQDAVRRSDAVIFVLSPGFFNKCTDKNDGCRVELEAALDADKFIVPVRLAGYSGKKTPAGIPKRLREFGLLQGVDIASLRPDVSPIMAINQRLRLNPLHRKSGKNNRKG
ncbi:MAG: toll/interleukin-1 receptor domain-containing protein [Kiritimatiellae bacterium]|nr:toll/interleukin-1 receptor domain-containing protein [Kiritimatiellia bacterium]